MTTDNILARLESLERSNRRWKVGSLSAFVLCGGAALLGLTPGQESQDIVGQRTVTASKLVITDTKGNARVQIDCPADGPRVRLLDAKGKTMARLVSQPGATWLTLTYGKSSVELMALVSASWVNLRDQKGTIRHRITCNADRSYIAIFDPKRRTPRFTINCDAKRAYLTICDADGDDHRDSGLHGS